MASSPDRGGAIFHFIKLFLFTFEMGAVARARLAFHMLTFTNKKMHLLFMRVGINHPYFNSHYQVQKNSFQGDRVNLSRPPGSRLLRNPQLVSYTIIREYGKFPLLSSFWRQIVTYVSSATVAYGHLNVDMLLPLSLSSYHVFFISNR